MDKQRIKELETILDNLYPHWREIRRETIECFGDKEALKIIDFHANNWIDIVHWVSDEYPEDEQMNIVYIYWLRLFKEIYWLQFLFYTGNYQTAYRNLRYVLEMLCQAYYIDATHPDSTLDEQIDWARRTEEKGIFGWGLVKRALCILIDKREEEIRLLFKPLWSNLNRHVHPSVIQMDAIAEEDFAGLVTDSFSESLAKELQEVTDKVMDIICAMVLKRFPKAREHARNYKFIREWEDCLPNTMKIIRSDPPGAQEQNKV